MSFSENKNNVPEDFIEVCSLRELSEKRGKKIRLEDSSEIALFLYNGGIYVFSNTCPHQHINKIYQGYISDGFLHCPEHGWKFDIESGKRADGGKGVRVYESMQVSGKVFVKLPESSGNGSGSWKLL